MHVGQSIFFQNLIPGMTDAEVYAHELGMADRAEGLGFESIWSAEHHFAGYTMVPNPAQFLTYMAARTKRVKLGTMVMVLPWHDPVRVAEEITVLDHLSGGRVILGIGRGLGRTEFEGFRSPMGESRERFVEYSEAILGAIESGCIEYNGTYYKQPKKEIRPSPLKSFKGRVYASAVSPESSRIMARLGLGLMILPQKPWDKTVQELADYRDIYREIHAGEEAPSPLVACFTAVHEDEEVAKEMHQTYIRAYSRSALEHYEFTNENLANIKGYEYYGALASNIKKHGMDKFVNFLADLQIWGTPDQVVEKIIEYQKLSGAGGFMSALSYGGMPHDVARANQATFATKCLERLKSYKVGGESEILRAAA